MSRDDLLGMPDEDFWQQKRRLIALDPGSINLNAGTLSPTPIPVLRAVTRLRERQSESPSDFLWRQSGPLLARSRERLAAYLNCRTHDLLLIPNATFAVNLIAASMQLGPGDELLTTDHEYGAMMLCWRHHAQRAGFSVREIKLPYLTEDAAEIIAAFEREIRGETKVVFFSHVTTSSGLILPAQRLCALARARGVTSIIDGAHAPGMIPVDLSRIDTDFYTANCHKWMMCPNGAGFLHVRAEHKRDLNPLLISWGHENHDVHAADEPSPYDLGSYWQGNLEFHGTLDRCPQMVIAEALDFRAELGGEGAIASRVAQLSDYARTRIAACGLAPATPESPELRGALIAFAFPCDDLIRMRDRMWFEHRIECPVTRAAGKTFLRVSTAWFNTCAEIDSLVQAVSKIRS